MAFGVREHGISQGITLNFDGCYKDYLSISTMMDLGGV